MIRYNEKSVFITKWVKSPQISMNHFFPNQHKKLYQLPAQKLNLRTQKKIDPAGGGPSRHGKGLPAIATAADAETLCFYRVSASSRSARGGLFKKGRRNGASLLNNVRILRKKAT